MFESSHLDNKRLLITTSFFIMIFYVYILESESSGKWYYGFTEDIVQRIKDHQTNRSKYTGKHCISKNNSKTRATKNLLRKNLKITLFFTDPLKLILKNSISASRQSREGRMFESSHLDNKRLLITTSFFL
jgi:hypothetical protein